MFDARCFPSLHQVTEVPFKPAPMPWWGYAPLGIPQFLQDRPVRGAMYLGLQLGSLGASIGLWVKLDSYQNISGQVDDDTAASLVRQQQQLRAIQWSTAGLGWLAWGTSIGDSALSWRRATGVWSSRWVRFHVRAARVFRFTVAGRPHGSCHSC